MLETRDLILAKAKFSDWEALYRNVWSRPESAKYMAWTALKNEEEAKIRIQKTVKYQKDHDAYLVCQKSNGEAVGYAGVEELEPGVYQETGICLGPDYVGRGLGKQVILCLLEYCKHELRAKNSSIRPEAEIKRPEDWRRRWNLRHLTGKKKQIPEMAVNIL